MTDKTARLLNVFGMFGAGLHPGLQARLILAFLTHTVLEWMDDKYQLLRKKLHSRQRLFNDIRTLTSYLCFQSWDILMDFMLDSFTRSPAQPETG